MTHHIRRNVLPFTAIIGQDQMSPLEFRYWPNSFLRLMWLRNARSIAAHLISPFLERRSDCW